MHGLLVANFFLSTVPVPFVHFLECDIETVSQLSDQLCRPVRIPAEAGLKRLFLVIVEPVSWYFSLFGCEEVLGNLLLCRLGIIRWT